MSHPNMKAATRTPKEPPFPVGATIEYVGDGRSTHGDWVIVKGTRTTVVYNKAPLQGTGEVVSTDSDGTKRHSWSYDGKSYYEANGQKWQAHPKWWRLVEE